METNPKQSIRFIDLSKKHSVENEKKIYRYMPLGQFIDLIEKKRLPLVKTISGWEDPCEGILFEAILDAFCSYFAENKSVEPQLTKQETKKWTNFIKQFVYGSSWTSLPESDAMWRIYSPNKQGVKIQSTIGKLKKTIKNLTLPTDWEEVHYLIGRVTYNGFDSTDFNVEKFLSAYPHVFMYKRRPFKHEEEIRAILYRKVSIGQTYPQDFNVIYAPIHDNFIESVSIDPRSPEWLIDAITGYCKRSEVSMCEASTLYSKPDLFIE